MIVFLTSSPTGPLDGSRRVNGLDEKNSFARHLKKYWRADSRCLMIAASPSSYERNDEMTAFFRDAVQKAGLSVSAFDLWDDRTEEYSREKLRGYDAVFLGGGHVPTQHEFFERLRLRELMKGYEGIVIGISAGTMNSADIVYAQPELSGEAVDPEYVRFFKGLSLTKTMILPHFQMTRNQLLDGERLIEDITCRDSLGRVFLALPDGSYLLSDNQTETVWGEAYQISEGEIRQICRDEEHILWSGRSIT